MLSKWIAVGGVWAMLACTAAGGADWLQLGGNPQHTGYSGEKLKPPFKIQWNVQFQPERLYPTVQPVIAAGRLLIGTQSGNFYALDAKTGKRLWKFPAGAEEHVGPILGTAGAQGDRAFFASMDGCVYALNAADGSQAWRFESGLRTGFSTAVLLAEGQVFAANRGGTFFALNQADGKLAWTTALGTALMQSPACNEGRLYVAGMDMLLRALDAKTGKTLWTTKPIAGLAFKDYWPVVYKGLVIVRPMGGWDSFAFDERTGEPVDLKLPGGITMNGAVAPPCVAGNGQLVTAQGGGWAMLDVDTRKVTAITDQTGGRGNLDENMIANAAGELIFVMHCEEGNAQFTGCFDLATRKWTAIGGGPWLNMWSNTQGGGTSQGLVADGLFYHVSMHGIRCRAAAPVNKEAVR